MLILWRRRIKSYRRTRNQNNSNTQKVSNWIKENAKIRIIEKIKKEMIKGETYSVGLEMEAKITW